MITSGQQAVNSVATMIDGRSVKNSYLHIHNHDNTKDLFVGDKNVTINNGFKIMKQDSLEIFLPPLNDLYVVSDGGPHTISWLRVEVD